MVSNILYFQPVPVEMIQFDECCSNGLVQPPTRIYFYLHLVDFYGFHVGKYTSPMDPMGKDHFLGVFEDPGNRAVIFVQQGIFPSGAVKKNTRSGCLITFCSRKSLATCLAGKHEHGWKEGLGIPSDLQNTACARD